MRALGFRQHLIFAAAAVFGFALGIALLPTWLRSARPEQLPGFMTSVGLDARASYYFLAAIVMPTLLAPLAARPLARRFAQGRTWALVTAAAALSSSLWIALAQESVPWVLVPPLSVTLFCDRLRSADEGFSRRDAVLVPTVLCTFFALTDIAPNAGFGRRVAASACLVLFARLALPFLRPRRALRAAYCFAFSPLALFFQSHYVPYHQRHAGWPPLLFALLSPFLLRLFATNTLLGHRQLRLLIAFLMYPLMILFYASASSNLAAEGKPRGDLFEDAHSLAVASAMLRGARPYRDIIPTHGLIQDGLLDFLILRAGSQTAGHVLAVHGSIGGLISVSGYAVTSYAVGSADLGLLSYFLGASLGTAGGGLRAAPALLALAFIAGGVRQRQPRLFGYAVVALVIAVLTSLDFAAYTAMALIVAVIRLPSRRLRSSAIRSALIALALTGAVTLAALSLAGVAIAFVRTTLFEILPLGAVYALPPFSAPEILRVHRFPPDLLVGLLDRSAFLYMFWVLTLLGAAIRIQARGHAFLERWKEALLALVVWVIAAGISYAERQHLYFQFLVAPVTVSLATILWSRRTAVHRSGAMFLTVMLLVLAQPSAYLAVLDLRRHAHGPLEPGLTEVSEVSRARGALYTTRDAAIIRSAQKYATARLRADETFFDFTNRGALYFLLDRACPIRQVEVAFYERESQQQEVIARLIQNRHVLSALVPKDDDVSTTVDAVPNRQRAPLVWAYLLQHFKPEFEEGDVIFWRRIDG